MRLLAMLVLALFLAACSQDDLLQKFSSPTEQAEARAYIDHLRRHNYVEIERALDPSLKRKDPRPMLEQMANLLPAQDPSGFKLIGAQVWHTAGSKTVNSSFEYQFGEKWFLINVAVKERASARTIIGFNVVPQADSLQAQHRFTLAGKSALHYMILASAIFAAVLTLVALVMCARARIAKRKWLWVLFIVLGFGQLAINWTTGQWQVNPFSLQLFSAGAQAQLYSPWIISVSIPVGAICFLLWKRKRIAAQPVETTTPGA